MNEERELATKISRMIVDKFMIVGENYSDGIDAMIIFLAKIQYSIMDAAIKEEK